jgi:N-acetylneuraminic acid mutarotase
MDMNTRKCAGVFATTLLLVAAFRPGPITGLAGPGPLVATYSMSVARNAHSATLLADGSVLVAGGETCAYLADGGGCDMNGFASLWSAEIYHPDTFSWSATGSMSTSRFSHTATRLADGRVLVAGGFYEPISAADTPAYLTSAELYQPSTSGWITTGSAQDARGYAMATLLQDGSVLVAGGYNYSGPLASAELYHPDTGSWSSAGSMAQRHDGGTMTRLADGRVLVAGGATTVAELYDPASGTWSITGPMPAARWNYSATLLNDGTVLVAGGDALGSAEIFQPATGVWTATASSSTSHGPNGILLPDGTVLLPDSAAEVYDPLTRSWAATAGTIAASGQSATRLNDGRVLIAGGCCDPVNWTYIATAQIYSAPGTTADAPITGIGANFIRAEGSPLNGIFATFSDADPNGTAGQFSASIDWGDGTSSPGAVAPGPPFMVSGTHVYTEEGSFTVTTVISDVGGAFTSVRSNVSIADAPLTVGPIGSTLSAITQTAQTFTLGSLNDADPGGAPADYVVSIAWGDGTNSTGAVIVDAGGGFAIIGSHAYGKKGQFAVALSARDIGGYAAPAVSDSIRVSHQ